MRPTDALLRRFAVLACIACVACGDDAVSPTGTAVDAGVADAADAADTGAPTLDAASTDTTPDERPQRPTSPLDPCSTDTTGVWVLSEFFILREDATGAVAGFDLDDRVSGASDESSCNHVDRASPDGSRGIDNQFASLVPVIEGFGGGASLENGIANAVRDGELLYLLDIDWSDEACDTFSVGRAVGTPLLNALGRIVPHQTFDRDADATVAVGVCDAAQTCVYEASGERLPLALSFIGTPVSFNVADWRLRVDIEDDGALVGMLGGGIPVEDLRGIASLLGGADAPLRDAILGIVPSITDLAPDETGACQAMSVAFGFRAVPAFARDE